MRTAEQERARFTHLKTRDVADNLNCGRDLVGDLIKAGAFPDLPDGTPGVINVGSGDQVEYRIHPESFRLFKRDRKVYPEAA